jgi:dipeptidyl aminopeptidase/acylaminoacyl peptidase
MQADSGESTPLVSSKGDVFPSSFSPDGKRLAYVEQSAETHLDIWILPLDTTDPTHPKPGRPEAFLRTPSNEASPAFSPDGRWLAYVSDESGRIELYVRPVGGDSAGAGAKWQISKDSVGMPFPVWSRDGRQIAFLVSPHLSNLSGLPPPGSELDLRLMTVDLAVRDGALVAGTPRVFADVPIRSPGGVLEFDLHPDGRAAVFPGKAAGAEPKPSGSAHVNVLLNFSDELRRRVPVGKP